LIELQFSIPELCANFLNHSILKAAPTLQKVIARFSLVRLLVVKILQIRQDTSSVGLHPRRRHAESAVQHCCCGIGHQAELMECHTPSLSRLMQTSEVTAIDEHGTEYSDARYVSLNAVV
jgi:hypothetical protein